MPEISNLVNLLEDWNSQLLMQASKFMIIKPGVKVIVVDTHSTWGAALVIRGLIERLIPIAKALTAYVLVCGGTSTMLERRCRG